MPAKKIQKLSEHVTVDDDDTQIPEVNNIISKIQSSSSTAIRNFNEKWCDSFSWLINKGNRAYCQNCEKSLPNNLNLLKRHNDTASHISNVKTFQNQPKITSLEEIAAAGSVTEKKKIAEIKILMFLAKNNLPFTLTEQLVDLVKSLDNESKVCKNIKIGRTKATETITSLLCDEGTKEIVNIL